MFDIRVKNFRKFKDEKFRFKKFNMLYGVNSGGKSSVLKLLLALKESIDQSNWENNITFNSSLTGLSSFSEVVRNNDRNANIEIDISIGRKDFLPFFKKETKEMDLASVSKQAVVKTNHNTSIKYVFSREVGNPGSFNVVIKNKGIGELFIQPMNHADIISYDGINRNEKCIVVFKRRDGTQIRVGEFDYRRKAFLVMLSAYELEKSLNKRDTTPEKSGGVEYIFAEIAYLLISQNYLEDELLPKISLINTTGVNPKRHYSTLDRSVRSIDNVRDISGMVSHLNSLSKDFQVIVMKDLSRLLRQFEVCDKVDVNNHTKLHVSEITVTHKKVKRNLVDVGLGTAHLILMLYKINFLTKADKAMTLLIMEPESHIFPKLQSKFVEYLIKCAQNTNHAFIIESHSEYIMEKFQSEVKNKNVNTNDFSSYFFDGDYISEHFIDKAGMINPPFPSGLFDTSSDLLRDLF